MGLAAAGVVAFKAYQAASDPSVEIAFPQLKAMAGIAPWLAIPVMIGLLLYLVYRPLGKAGAPDEPAPPTAVM